jgi:hypothetical protein
VTAPKGPECLLRRDRLARDEVKLARNEHFLGEVFHHGLGLNMKVPHHFVRAPTAEERDDVFINIGAEERHSAAGAKGPCANIFWEEPQRGADGGHRKTKGGGDVFCGNRAKFVGLKIRGQGRFEVVGVLPEVQYTPEHRFDGAKGEGPAAAMVNHFALH